MAAFALASCGGGAPGADDMETACDCVEMSEQMMEEVKELGEDASEDDAFGIIEDYQEAIDKCERMAKDGGEEYRKAMMECDSGEE